MPGSHSKSSRAIGAFALALFTAGACATGGAAGTPAATPAPAAASPTTTTTTASPATAPAAPAPPPIARVSGEPLSAADLQAHQAATGLPRAAALDDLVDLTLLRRAARDSGVAIPPGPLTPDARATAERDLAGKLGLEIPAPGDTLVVDHAWVKDAEQPKHRAAQRKTIDRLRALCAAGDSIPAVYNKLGVVGAGWHIGDHEEYPYDVVPPEAHDLPAGSLSPVVPGNGGLHLFKIIERKRARSPADELRAQLRARLRQGQEIELIDSGDPQ